MDTIDRRCCILSGHPVLYGNISSPCTVNQSSITFRQAKMVSGTLLDTMSALSDQILTSQVAGQAPTTSKSSTLEVRLQVKAICCPAMYHYSKMFRWEPEGRYRHRIFTAVAPFWFSTAHLWMLIAPFWLVFIFTWSVESQGALSLFKDVPLRTRRALSP